MILKVKDKFNVINANGTKGKCTVYIDENCDIKYEIYINRKYWIIIYSEEEFKYSSWEIIRK